MEHRVETGILKTNLKIFDKSSWVSLLIGGAQFVVKYQINRKDWALCDRFDPLQPIFVVAKKINEQYPKSPVKYPNIHFNFLFSSAFVIYSYTL